MPLVKNAATSLAQGVSQQAESQRYPSQATEQINAYSSPIKGLVKRPPSKFISDIAVDTGGTAFAHTINRDNTEQYTLVVNPYTAITINSFNTSVNSINISTTLSVNDAVRFSIVSKGGNLPRGLSSKLTYYVLSSSASGDTHNITVSKTKGGSIVKIGKAEIDSIRISSVKDSTTDQWVDGVYEVTFAANHGFSAGDHVRIENLTGKALQLFDATQEYELRVPDNYNYYYTYSSSSYSVETWDTNTFILGKIGGNKNSIADNLGYYVDTQWQTDNDDDGYNMVGDGSPSSSNLHFVLLDGTGAITHNKGNKLKWDHSGAGGAETTWPSGWDASKLVGSVIRLGSRSNLSKAYRAKVTAADISARTITLNKYVDLNDTLFDSDIYNNGNVISYNTTNNPKWVYIAYWGDTTSSSYLAGSNPRQFTASETDNAFVGSNDAVGTVRIEKGGIQIYDVKTGVEKPLIIDSGLDYITKGNNPNANLKAVTVADHTFLVNTSVKTEAFNKPKYDKRYEAIITARTADYGKRYKVKVGAAASPTETALIEGASGATKAYVDIAGFDRDKNGNKWVARIQSKTSDPKYNNWQIRFVQHWKWDDTYFMPHFAGAKNQTRTHTDLLPPTELTQFDDTDQGLNYYYLNEKIAVHEMTRDGSQLTIYGNFSWASKNSDPLSYLTTVQDLIDVFKNTPDLAANWEVKTLTGNDSTSTAATATDDSNAPYYTFQKCIVGNKGEPFAMFDGKGTYISGRDESINVGWVVGAGGATVPTQYMTSGYLSPSVKDTNIEREYYTSKAGRALTGSQWDTTNGAYVNLIESGEYWYKTPKWTGLANQIATGTEKIAEMLASSAKIVAGKWLINSPKKANGRTITEKPAGSTGGAAATGDAAAGKEEGFGLTYQSNNSGYLYDSNASGSNKRLLGFDTNWQVQQQGYTIALQAPDRKQFQITVEDDLGGRGLKLTYFEVGESADLPDVCRHGHIVKVVGNAREAADDYYLRFEADDPNELDTLQQGRWVECLGYEQMYKFKASTMPVSILREFDESNNITFRLKEIDWNERQAGDNQSNPFPSFTGSTINDIFLFRNRLGFLSGENIIFSEAGEYFNFFRTTVAALLDTAPIDVTASTNKVSKLHSAIPYNERLIIFSDQTQFVLDADPFLSPKTVTLSPANEIDNIVGVKPVVSGNSVYYAFKRTGYSGVGELGVSQEDADQMEVANATSHIPKYIKGNIRKIASTSNEDVICCITDDTTSATLYVYKYFNNEQNQKVQSAWFKYNFGAAQDFIHDISFIDTTLYMVIKRGSVMYLESMTFEDDVKDAKASGTMDYQVCLDHRIDKPSSGVTSSSVTLPSNYKVTSTMKLVDEDGNQFSSSTHGNTNVFTCTVPTSKNFFIGEPYTMEYTFSQPFLKSAKATETGRYQIQRAYLEYANARYFTVDVLHNPNLITSAQTNVTNTFSLSIIEQGLIDGTSELQNGFYAFAIQEKNDRLQLTLKNDSPYPSDFLSIDYEARAFSRGSRWRG